MSLRGLVDAGLVRTGIDLRGLTTYRLGGPAAYLLDGAGETDLATIATVLAEDPIPVLVLGRGSNVVISEKGFDGLVIRLGRDFTEIELRQDVAVVGGIVPLPQVARTTAAAGKRGIEFLIGVPGSAGGGVRQNAGCFGCEIADVLLSATVFDLLTGQSTQRSVDDLQLAYRHSAVKPNEVVTSVAMRVKDGDAAEGLDLIRDHTRWRRIHQPGGTLNAGSVFKNPAGDSAGRIIDAAGLKGLRVGGAEVSTKHANFFVAMPGAEASDVYLLVQEVRRRVELETGILLEPEIQFVGDFGKHSHE
jgi:UDP-N-acetylmuramate dehydrogenase